MNFCWDHKDNDLQIISILTMTANSVWMSEHILFMTMYQQGESGLRFLLPFKSSDEDGKLYGLELSNGKLGIWFRDKPGQRIVSLN